MTSAAMVERRIPAGVNVTALEAGDASGVLSRDALEFVANLTRQFRPGLRAALARRELRQRSLAAGGSLGFLPETASIRHNRTWSVAAAPRDLVERKVEITGPVDRKMMINALNSGADVFMADFEDATAPTWENVVRGQRNVADAVRGTITYDDPGTGKAYRLGTRLATLIVRPRGLHLVERHLIVDGSPAPASLVDFGLFFWHNAHALVARGSGPYLYLPKLESHLEARLWNDVFVAAQRAAGLPRGTIRATVLIETLPAAFEMEEILYELREHASGLNCGRWDYIFSSIKTRRHDPAAVYPDRAQVTMAQPSMRAYSRLLIEVCHRRGAHAIGGMSAFIPVKDDTSANERAFTQIRADKLREVTDGHDGTWVAHPALVSIAREVFDAQVAGPHQIDRERPSPGVAAADLLAIPQGARTEAGLRQNVRVGIRYIEAWLRGVGAVPLYNLMEDAATAEISRAQVWQWMHHHVPLEDGTLLSPALLRMVIDQEMAKVRVELGAEAFATGRFSEATQLFESLVIADSMPDFLTTLAYQHLA
ncbi:MAG: malate synthase A [Gemmatimonadaceae bacterium]